MNKAIASSVPSLARCVAPTRNIPDIPASARLASDARSSPIRSPCSFAGPNRVRSRFARPFPACVLVLLGCSVETAGLRRPDAALPHDGGADSELDAARVDGGPDAGRDSGGTDGGGTDAGARAPTEPVTLASSGSHGAHPAVAWTGSEFIVGYVAGDGSGGQVELVRMGPGAAPGGMMRQTATAAPRRSVTLAPNGTDLAVGWTVETVTGWQLAARTNPSGPGGIFEPVEVTDDHDDVHLMWESGSLYGVARQSSASDEALVSLYFDGSAVELGDIATASSFGELVLLDTSSGPVLATGAGSLFQLADGSWSAVGAMDVSPDQLLEGDLAEIGTDLAGVWSIRRDADGERALYGVRLVSDGGGWNQDGGAVPLGWRGPDPAVDSAAGRIVVVWPDETDGARVLGVAMLDAELRPVVDRCHVVPERPVANDPDIACAAGWCAVVWVEGEDYSTDAFVTRVMQLPLTPDLVCP